MAPARAFSVSKARDRLTALLNEVEAGREILITRRGKPVARLLPVKPVFDRLAACRAVDCLLQASEGLSLGSLSIRDLINGGRR